MFKLVISERAKTPQSRALEVLGSYNPHSKELQLNQERVQHWLDYGATTSETVNNLLIDKGIIQGEKTKTISLSKKRKEKIKKKKEDKKEASQPSAEKTKQETSSPEGQPEREAAGNSEGEAPKVAGEEQGVKQEEIQEGAEEKAEEK